MMCFCYLLEDLTFRPFKTQTTETQNPLCNCTTSQASTTWTLFASFFGQSNVHVLWRQLAIALLHCSPVGSENEGKEQKKKENINTLLKWQRQGSVQMSKTYGGSFESILGAVEAAAEVLIVYVWTPHLLPPIKKKENVKLYRTEVHIGSVHYSPLSEDFLIHQVSPVWFFKAFSSQLPPHLPLPLSWLSLAPNRRYTAYQTCE